MIGHSVPSPEISRDRTFLSQTRDDTGKGPSTTGQGCHGTGQPHPWLVLSRGEDIPIPVRVSNLYSKLSWDTKEQKQRFFPSIFTTFTSQEVIFNQGRLNRRMVSSQRDRTYVSTPLLEILRDWFSNFASDHCSNFFLSPIAN